MAIYRRVWRSWTAFTEVVSMVMLLCWGEGKGKRVVRGEREIVTFMRQERC